MLQLVLDTAIIHLLYLREQYFVDRAVCTIILSSSVFSQLCFKMVTQRPGSTIPELLQFDYIQSNCRLISDLFRVFPLKSYILLKIHLNSYMCNIDTNVESATNRSIIEYALLICTAQLIFTRLYRAL